VDLYKCITTSKGPPPTTKSRSTHTPYVGPLPESTTTSKGPFFPPLREDPPTPHMFLPSTITRKEGRKEGQAQKGVLSYATKL